LNKYRTACRFGPARGKARVGPRQESLFLRFRPADLTGIRRVEIKQEEKQLHQQFQSGENLTTTILIEGYELVFWKKESILVDCANIRTVTRELSGLMGTEILPVHLSSLREGD